MEKLKIFTDGSCLSNPGEGSWAFLALQENGIISLHCGYEKSTTNNRMEIVGATKALEFIKTQLSSEKKIETEIYTDSQYVCKGISEWISGWKKNNWKTSQKTPVKNKELWQELDDLNSDIKPVWTWVKAHDTNAYNNLVDKAAQFLARNKGFADFTDFSEIIRSHLPKNHFRNTNILNSAKVRIRIEGKDFEEDFKIQNRFNDFEKIPNTHSII